MSRGKKVVQREGNGQLCDLESSRKMKTDKWPLSLVTLMSSFCGIMGQKPVWDKNIG